MFTYSDIQDMYIAEEAVSWDQIKLGMKNFGQKVVEKLQELIQKMLFNIVNFIRSLKGSSRYIVPESITKFVAQFHINYIPFMEDLMNVFSNSDMYDENKKDPDKWIAEDDPIEDPTDTKFYNNGKHWLSVGAIWADAIEREYAAATLVEAAFNNKLAHPDPNEKTNEVNYRDLIKNEKTIETMLRSIKIALGILRFRSLKMKNASARAKAKMEYTIDVYKRVVVAMTQLIMIYQRMIMKITTKSMYTHAFQKITPEEKTMPYFGDFPEVEAAKKASQAATESLIYDIEYTYAMEMDTKTPVYFVAGNRLKKNSIKMLGIFAQMKMRSGSYANAELRKAYCEKLDDVISDAEDFREEIVAIPDQTTFDKVSTVITGILGLVVKILLGINSTYMMFPIKAEGTFAHILNDIALFVAKRPIAEKDIMRASMVVGSIAGAGITGRNNIKDLKNVFTGNDNDRRKSTLLKRLDFMINLLKRVRNEFAW